MLYIERKTETGFEYELQELFGTIKISSPEKLSDPETKHEKLDAVTLAIIRSNLPKGEFPGAITFTFEKSDQWDEDDDLKPNK